MTDTILFVKETQTCRYVLHIATPRLCGEPGFRSSRDAHEEAYIRCREIVSPETYAQADRTLPEADHPFKMPPRPQKPVIAPPPADEQEKPQDDKKLTQNEVIRKALEKLVTTGDLKAGEVTIIEDGDDEVIIEFLDYGEDGESPSLQDILRAHGIDVIKEKATKDSKESEDEGSDKEAPDGDHGFYVRDEL